MERTLDRAVTRLEEEARRADWTIWRGVGLGGTLGLREAWHWGGKRVALQAR